MKQKSVFTQIILFTLFIVVLLISNNLIKEYLISKDITSYNIHLGIKAISNCILGLISFFVAKTLGLSRLGGLSKIAPEKLWLVLFPLLYLSLLNGVFIDDIPDHTYLNLVVLIVYCVSIGISEELSIRSVLLPLFIRLFGKSKKSYIKAIFISSLIFGLLHLIKFDKGIYGEISQVFFATFIGILFGAILLVVKRVYPLIIAHAVIDFVAKLDAINTPVKEAVSKSVTLENSLLSVILTLPCLLYGIYVMKKHVSFKNTFS